MTLIRAGYTGCRPGLGRHALPSALPALPFLTLASFSGSCPSWSGQVAVSSSVLTFSQRHKRDSLPKQFSPKISGLSLGGSPLGICPSLSQSLETRGMRYSCLGWGSHPQTTWTRNGERWLPRAPSSKEGNACWTQQTASTKSRERGKVVNSVRCFWREGWKQSQWISHEKPG